MVNPEINQDRVFDLYEMFNKWGQIMFPQQQTIYTNLAEYLSLYPTKILEAGCGTGQGTALLQQVASGIIGTDKLQRNIDFARLLYPWIDFQTWDINQPTNLRAPVVVCIEAFEHVDNPQAAMDNLLDATGKTLWLSTPNGKGKPRPPENPYHVCEYTPQEMLDFLPRGLGVKLWHWETWEPQGLRTQVDPIVYQIQK